jgi:hypothetical protein
VCIKCKKLCWKAEAIVAAINANDVAAMQVWERVFVAPRLQMHSFIRNIAIDQSAIACYSLLRMRVCLFTISQRYVDRKMDCNLHTGVYPPLTVAGNASHSNVIIEACRLTTFHSF